MTKTRPVLVVRRHKTNSKLVTIVPLSTTKPDPMEPYHYEFPKNPVPQAMPWEITWAKCDMVSTVSIDRLDRFRVKFQGKREYVEPSIGNEEFQIIKECVSTALGLGKTGV